MGHIANPHAKQHKNTMGENDTAEKKVGHSCMVSSSEPNITFKKEMTSFLTFKREIVELSNISLIFLQM